ncbi:MAG: host-nuclease inhibitor Gam family protein [Patescibacteria group bacterium]|nr:host-nuclease inhibitor Gam family protein [Patescibacteria group bacterium]
MTGIIFYFLHKASEKRKANKQKAFTQYKWRKKMSVQPITNNPYELMDSEDIEILSEHPAEDQLHDKFRVNTDQKAEWVLNKIKERHEEYDRLAKACQEQSDFYSLKKNWYLDQAQKETSYFKGLLSDYFEKVPHKKTKTQKKYSLPSGDLIRKKQNPEYIRDDEQILGFLGENNLVEFIKNKPQVNWVDLKAQIEIKESQGNKQTAFLDGKMIDGLNIQERPDIFEVKVK